MSFTVNDPDVSVEGTCLQGHVDISYAELVERFGQPRVEPYAKYGNHNVAAQWVLTFASGQVATIYNYQDGKNYLGDDEGLDVEDIRDWHIGGLWSDVVTHVVATLRDRAPKRPTGETPATDIHDGPDPDPIRETEFVPGEPVRLKAPLKLYASELDDAWATGTVTYEETTEYAGSPPMAVVRGTATVHFTTSVPLRDLEPLESSDE